MTEQQLWVAVHLLYPNSSQALDVYHIILGSVPKINDANYTEVIFSRLENFFLKNPTVRSGQPFRVFEESSLEHWNVLYKKSLKSHLLIIVGLIIFEFSIEDVSRLLKISDEKTRFLINQAFKKLTEFSLRTPAIDMQFRFKTVSDQKVSYFFTNENLVGYCLNILSPKDKVLVEQGLLLYSQLQILQKKYIEIISELHRLVKSSETQIEPHPLAPMDLAQGKAQVKSIGWQLPKSIWIASAVTGTFLILVIVRPISFNKLIKRSGTTSIKIHEINSQPTLAEQKNDEIKTKTVSLHEMPVESKTKKELFAAAASLNAIIEPAKNVGSKTIEKKNLVKAKQGGLYRGSIVVSDLETVATKITDKLVDLGGRKAGEVELGWRKNPHLAYYHLTMPEGSVQDAKDFLKNFGQLKLDFENHPRLMPNGTKRIILEVREVE